MTRGRKAGSTKSTPTFSRPIQLAVTQEVGAKFATLAAERGISESALGREIVNDYCRRKEVTIG
jgi:hypothetical protein